MVLNGDGKNGGDMTKTLKVKLLFCLCVSVRIKDLILLLKSERVVYE